MAAIASLSELKGAEKAAVFLLALGEDHKTLWEFFDEEEIKEISQAMSNLGNVQSDAVEELVVDFVGRISNTGAVMGSVLFRLLVAIALRWGLNPNDLKLITALFVFAALVTPALLRKLRPAVKPSAT